MQQMSCCELAFMHSTDPDLDIRLKKKVNAMSQSSWQIGRPDLNVVFLTVFFSSSSSSSFFSEQQTCQIWVVHSFEIWNLILDEQDTRQDTELKKSVVQSVSLCLSYLFLYILTSKFIKKTGKKIKQAKKNSNLEFCWIKFAPKNKCAWQLWDIGFIFFSLSGRP